MKKLYFLLFISLFLAIPCAAEVIIVDANGTGDYPTIQAAIDDSNDGDTIILAEGIYTGVGNRDIDFKGKAITVRSTDPQDPNIVISIIIDCQGAGRGFYFHSGEDANSILNGLKITNGYVTSSSPGGNAGGGIYCGNESSPTIANCDISGNTAAVDSSGSGFGGGLYGCNGTITNCIISGNTAAGAMPFGYRGRGGGLYACDGMITNCTISGNTATDGGLGGGLSGCNGTIINCTVSGNKATVMGRGGGLYGCNGTITNCIISGNTADGVLSPGRGGGLYACDGTITNCTISGNTATEGGLGGGLGECNGTIINCNISGNSAVGYLLGGGRGGGLYGCNETITNCTISGNTAAGSGGPTGDGRGGGLYGSNGTITNCIIWSNSADVGPELYSSSGPNYSCIQNWGGGGIGNIDADPCFVDLNNDYHLKSQAGRWDTNSESWLVDDVTSPCIDAGDPMFPIGLELFPNGGIINMGAYGGTPEASKSYFGEPLCEIIVAGDVNGDCVVNFLDFRLMALHWCEDNNP